MHYRENLNIIVMRDNGPRRSYHVRRNRFYLIIVLFACLPFLCILLAAQCWTLWNDNRQLRDNVEKFEADYQAAEMRAERLENLEELLLEENTPGRRLLAARLAHPANEPEPETSLAPEAAMDDGPGHEDFPALDTGRVKVSNVQARIIRGNSLRIGLDLRNPDNENLLSGDVRAILVTADGKERALNFSPGGVGNFRINRFKRSVMTAQLPREISTENARIILEVVDDADKLIYRNIFAVQH